VIAQTRDGAVFMLPRAIARVRLMKHAFFGVFLLCNIFAGLDANLCCFIDRKGAF